MRLLEDLPRFDFPGPFRMSQCRLRIYRSEPGEVGPDLVLVATELNDNPGMSVTNAAESLWTLAASRAQIQAGLFGPCADIRSMFFEHYEGDPTQPVDTAFGEHYARVLFADYGRDGIFRRPKWEHATKAQVELLTSPLLPDGEFGDGTAPTDQPPADPAGV